MQISFCQQDQTTAETNLLFEIGLETIVCPTVLCENFAILGNAALVPEKAIFHLFLVT